MPRAKNGLPKMIRHILLFSFRAEAPEEVVQKMLVDFSRFPQRFPQMNGWQMGRNESRRDRSFDYAVTVQFADWAALNAYLDSPEHEKFVAERFLPLISRRAIATFEPTVAT